jgi:hypothetical protein
MATEAPPTPPGSPAKKDSEKHDPAGILAGAPDGLEGAAKDADGVGPKEESEALDFLLGATQALRYDVPVTYDTPKGSKKLCFVIEQIDGKRIIELEKEYRNGTGPFAEVDDIGLNAAIVYEAAIKIVEGSSSDDEKAPAIEVASEQFRGGIPSGPDAMQIRFKYQPGLLDGIAGEIRRVSGYATDRVGQAERAGARATISNAVENS